MVDLGIVLPAEEASLVRFRIAHGAHAVRRVAVGEEHDVLLGTLAATRLGVRELEATLPVRALVPLGSRRDGVGDNARVACEACSNLGVRAKRHNGDLDLFVGVLAGEQLVRKGLNGIVGGLHTALAAPTAHLVVHARRHVHDEHDVHRLGGRGLLRVAGDGQREVVGSVPVVLDGLVVLGHAVNDAAPRVRERDRRHGNAKRKQRGSGYAKQSPGPGTRGPFPLPHDGSSPPRRCVALAEPSGFDCVGHAALM